MIPEDNQNRFLQIEPGKQTVLKQRIEDLKKLWLENIAKIDGKAIDDNGVESICARFNHDKLMLTINSPEDNRSLFNELDSVESKLTVALEIARSKYKLQNRGLWARIFGGLKDDAKEIVTAKQT